MCSCAREHACERGTRLTGAGGGRVRGYGEGVGSEGIKYRKNEIFLDVVESVNILVGSSGNILRSEILGALKMRSVWPCCRGSLSPCALSFVCIGVYWAAKVRRVCKSVSFCRFPFVAASPVCFACALPFAHISIYVCISHTHAQSLQTHLHFL